MPDILWWFLIGLLQILSLMLLPAIPVVVWVLWEWYRQETEGLSVADWRDQAACVGDLFLIRLLAEWKTGAPRPARCRACREPVSPSDEPAHQGAVRYGGRGMCSRCYQKAKDQRRKTRAHS